MGEPNYGKALKQGILLARGDVVICDEIDLCDTNFYLRALPLLEGAEARGAASPADFAHKLGIVIKELNETRIWLRIIERSQIIKPQLLTEIIKENTELCKIFTASLKTTRLGRNDK